MFRLASQDRAAKWSLQQKTKPKTGQKRSEMLRQKKKLSYTDCLGLVVAEEFKTKVLTGDKEFKNLPSTEFVKKPQKNGGK